MWIPILTPVSLVEKNVNGSASQRHLTNNHVSTFQQIHDRIGKVLQKELDEYKKCKEAADKPPDEPLLINFD